MPPTSKFKLIINYNNFEYFVNLSWTCFSGDRKVATRRKQSLQGANKFTFVDDVQRVITSVTVWSLGQKRLRRLYDYLLNILKTPVMMCPPARPPLHRAAVLRSAGKHSIVAWSSANTGGATSKNFNLVKQSSWAWPKQVTRRYSCMYIHTTKIFKKQATVPQTKYL